MNKMLFNIEKEEGEFEEAEPLEEGEGGNLSEGDVEEGKDENEERPFFI